MANAGRMSWCFFVASLLTCCFLIDKTKALDNGLSVTPAMGFNTWNTFYCSIDENLIRDLMATFVGLGLKDAGYVYFNLDDCWQAPARNQTTYALYPHPEKFPSGMRALSALANSMGLKFGIYSDAGIKTCGGYPGSLGYEQLDAATFASWGVDYVKYDNCWAQFSRVPQKARYAAMRDALNDTKRPIVYSLCSWGVDQPWLWGAQVGNSWRTTGDINPTWKGMLANLDRTIGLARYAGPGGWNDPDMLEVGNLASLAEDRSHFAIWALLKSPLLIGADVRKLSNESLAVLKTQAIIALNQDALGVAGDLIAGTDMVMVLAAPLVEGGRGLILFNRNDSGVLDITVDISLLGYPPRLEAKVTELYSNSSGLMDGLGANLIGCRVGPHDVCVLRIQPITPTPDMDQWRPWTSHRVGTCSPIPAGGLWCSHARSWFAPPPPPVPFGAAVPRLIFQTKLGRFTQDVVELLPPEPPMAPQCALLLLAALLAVVLLLRRAALRRLRGGCRCCRRNRGAQQQQEPSMPSMPGEEGCARSLGKGCCEGGVLPGTMVTVLVPVDDIRQPLLAKGCDSGSDRV